VILLRPLAPLLARAAARYIEQNAAQYRPTARKLTISEFDLMSRFFPAETLHRARIAAANVMLKPPKIQKLATVLGMEALVQPDAMAAITFNNVIVHYESLSMRTLFHELVHVEQYKQLKLAGFAKHYVSGFLRTGKYEQIPLEVQAYGLDARFAANPSLNFSVRDEVEKWISENKFRKPRAFALD
jgi:hypothetical protein